MWRIKAFIHKLWEVECYHPRTGDPCGLAGAVLPPRRFRTETMANHDAWAMNNQARLQDARHRYRVVSR